MFFFFLFFLPERSSFPTTNTDTTGGGGGGTPGGSVYYIKCKKDGVQKSYSEYASANILDLSSGATLSIFLVAGLPNSMEGFNIGISFFNGATIKTGTYTEGSLSPEYLVVGVYNPNSTNIVYAAGLQLFSIKPLVITILTKTTTEMTGKFEGAFYKQNLTGAPSTEYILFTEGEFKLPIK